MCRTIKLFISNWPRTRNFIQLLQAGKTVAFAFAHHGHALVTLYVQLLCSDWSKFDMWVHEENLCTILNLVYFDSWSWQSFMSTCDVFNCLFPLDVQYEIQLLSGVFCWSWLVCLLNFWLRNTSLDFGWHCWRFSPFLIRKEGWKVWSDTGFTRYLSGAASRMVSLSNYCIWCFFLYLI